MGFPHGVWFDVDTSHMAPYFVEFETGGITDDVFAQVGVVGANVTSFTDMTVGAGQHWEYRVIAVGAQAPSAPSNVVAAAIP